MFEGFLTTTSILLQFLLPVLGPMCVRLPFTGRSSTILPAAISSLSDCWISSSCSSGDNPLQNSLNASSLSGFIDHLLRRKRFRPNSSRCQSFAHSTNAPMRVEHIDIDFEQYRKVRHMLCRIC